MPLRYLAACVTGFLTLPGAAPLAAGQAAPVSPDILKVMTFNVRMPSPNDGPNVWEKRRDLVVAAIRARSPDVIGTQELFHHQGQYIEEKAPEYAWFGRSRRGNHEDEHMGVFYRKSRLRLLEEGDFWLSETPATPGSMSWNVSLPRMVAWGLFEVRGAGRKFYLYNTHFAHRGQDEEARALSARLIASRISKLPAGTAVVLTGDFNSGAGSEAYEVFEPLLEDAWLEAGERSGPEDTFHGFSGKPRPGRIDWIWYRGGLRALKAETVTYNQDGRYPSDHFPVYAELEFTSAY